MNDSSEATIELRVNGLFVGMVSSIEYTRPARQLPSIDGYARLAPGNEITVSIQLITPVSLQEKWRLLEKGEEVRIDDEWYSHWEMKWFPLSVFNPNLPKLADGDLYRRKALVLV